MKGSASGYGVSGSGEYNKTDYQEHRKDTLLSGGMVIAVIVVIGAIIWLFWDKLTSQITGVFDGAGNMLNARQADAVTNVLKGSNQNKPAVAEARNNLGEYYPIKTLTQTDYDKMLSEAGAIPASIVRLGNVITPNELLSYAAGQGADAANTVNRLGLNDAYWKLPDVQRGLVTVGEGIGKTFGVDLIQAGADFASKSKGIIPPIGSNIRAPVGAGTQPSEGQQNLNTIAWNEYYGGVT
jgi:hypothetical protein